MNSIARDRNDVIVGVDTHKDQHVCVAIDGLGSWLGELCAPTTTEGYTEVLAWSAAQGRVEVFAVEAAGSYGTGLVRFLRRHGMTVMEVDRPVRKGERRLRGKSDTIDAEHAARQVIAGHRMAIPKSADGAVEMLRLVKIARDTAVKAHSQAMISLKAVVVTAEDDLRAELEPLSNYRLILACAALEPEGHAGPEAATRHVLGSLARRWLGLHEEIKIHTRYLQATSERIAPRLLDAFGIGPDIASELLVAAGDNAERVRSEAAFAKLCGACPIPASSGKTQRHRLNRGGNRQANSALYRAVIVRMRWHQPTMDYVARRTAEGLSKREIIRCLKRYVAREVYHLLPKPTGSARESLALDGL